MMSIKWLSGIFNCVFVYFFYSPSSYFSYLKNLGSSETIRKEKLKQQQQQKYLELIIPDPPGVWKKQSRKTNLISNLMTSWFGVIPFYVTSDFRLLSLTNTCCCSGAGVTANCISTPSSQRWCRTSEVSRVIREALWKHFYAFSSLCWAAQELYAKGRRGGGGCQKKQRGKSAPARRFFF